MGRYWGWRWAQGLGFAIVFGGMSGHGVVSALPVENKIAPVVVKPDSLVCTSTEKLPPTPAHVEMLQALMQQYKVTVSHWAISRVPGTRCEFAAILSAVEAQVDTVIRLTPPSPGFPINKKTVEVLLRLYKAYDTELAFFPFAGGIGDGRAGKLERRVLFRSPIRLNSGEGGVIDEVFVNP